MRRIGRRESRALWLLVAACLAIPGAAGVVMLYVSGSVYAMYAVIALLVLPVLFKGLAVVEARFPTRTEPGWEQRHSDMPWPALSVLTALTAAVTMAMVAGLDAWPLRLAIGVLMVVSIVVLLQARRKAGRT